MVDITTADWLSTANFETAVARLTVDSYSHDTLTAEMRKGDKIWAAVSQPGASQ